MDNVNIDFKALLNAAMITSIENSNKKGSKQTAAVMKVFQNHGIDVMDALCILTELSVAIKNSEKEGE